MLINIKEISIENILPIEFIKINYLVLNFKDTGIAINLPMVINDQYMLLIIADSDISILPSLIE